jgi:hypothetical protein
MQHFSLDSKQTKTFRLTSIAWPLKITCPLLYSRYCFLNRWGNFAEEFFAVTQKQETKSE